MTTPMREEERAKRRRGALRHYARNRYLREVGPSHAYAYFRSGRRELAPQLRPIVERRADQMVAMQEDLGGASQVSAMERAVLEGWFEAMVCADAILMPFLRGEVQDVPEKLATLLNTARAALQSVGLRRRPRDAGEFDLGEYERALRGSEQRALAPRPAGGSPEVAGDGLGGAPASEPETGS